MPAWKRVSEELASSGKESGFVLGLGTSALESHKSDCDFLRRKVDRLKKHLGGLFPSDESYCTANRAILVTKRQWPTMSGVMSALDAASARLKEKERFEAKIEARQFKAAGGPAGKVLKTNFFEINFWKLIKRACAVGMD